jgi:hypothetical protein
MNEIVIKLSGEIHDSNFDEWKKDLITQIQSTKKELVTDDDFVLASEQVKSFKLAEKSLIIAKQSAIEQASDIQRLFGAIDEISAEARQARLSLERQIKKRKTEIKDEMIESGINLIQEILEKQSTDFRSIDYSIYLERKRFEEAVKRKSGIKGMNSAVISLSTEIKNEILDKVNDIETNGTLIDSISEEYGFLFQDRKSLLILTLKELELTVENRISKFKESKAQKETKGILSELKTDRNIDLKTNDEIAVDTELSPSLEKFQIIINILSTKDYAADIAQSIKQTLENNSTITNIQLTRIHDEL